jgi:hypothetical protein
MARAVWPAISTSTLNHPWLSRKRKGRADVESIERALTN